MCCLQKNRVETDCNQRTQEVSEAANFEIFSGLDNIGRPYAPKSNMVFICALLEVVQTARDKNIAQRIDRAHTHLGATASSQDAVTEFLKYCAITLLVYLAKLMKSLVNQRLF
jgi:hypothetical protein